MRLPLTLFSLVLAGCVSSSHTITGNARNSILPEAVKFYATVPPHAEQIGLITARGYTGGQIGNDHAMAELRNQAAKMGANGVFVTGTSIEGFSGWTGHSTVLTAQAFFVP